MSCKFGEKDIPLRIKSETTYEQLRTVGLGGGFIPRVIQIDFGNFAHECDPHTLIYRHF